VAELRAMMTAVVLAGGFGTRLRSVVSDRPKVLAPVAGRRFVAYLLDQLADAGFQQTIVCTGHLGDQVREAFGNRWRKLQLRYSQEPEPLGTAGALRYALDSFPMDEMLVLNGDSFCEVDLRALAELHHSRRAAATIAVTEVPDAGRYGGVKIDAAGAVSSFAEKGTAGPGLINAGVYALDRQFVASIPSGIEVSLERDCFPQIIGKGLYAHRVDGRFLDIGTPDSFAAAQNLLAPHAFGEGHGSRPYALVDRDGTINVERHYLSHPDHLELLPGAVEGMKKIRALGMGLAIVSNQSGLARGYFDAAQLERIHDRLRAMLGDADLAVDGIYFCPHEPEAKCGCRKPEVGMVTQAATDLGFDPRHSFVVGDKPCDIEMGQRLNATTLLVRTGYGKQSAADGVDADYIVDDLSEAADCIAAALQGECQASTATV
jgi:D-glycero-alpha-D-manno-heptose 1-phosphate guanylyltransferase